MFPMDSRLVNMASENLFIVCLYAIHALPVCKGFLMIASQSKKIFLKLRYKIRDSLSGRYILLPADGITCRIIDYICIRGY